MGAARATAKTASSAHRNRAMRFSFRLMEKVDLRQSLLLLYRAIGAAQDETEWVGYSTHGTQSVGVYQETLPAVTHSTTRRSAQRMPPAPSGPTKPRWPPQCKIRTCM